MSGDPITVRNPADIANAVRELRGDGRSDVPITYSGYLPPIDGRAPIDTPPPPIDWAEVAQVEAVNSPTRLRRQRVVEQQIQAAEAEAPLQGQGRDLTHLPAAMLEATLPDPTGDYVSLDASMAMFNGHIVELSAHQVRAISLVLTKAVEDKLTREIARVRGTNARTVQPHKQPRKAVRPRRSRTKAVVPAPSANSQPQQTTSAEGAA